MKDSIIYPKLSYEIMGALFEVWNSLGAGYQEKHYQRALEAELIKRKISFRAQAPYKLAINKKIVGRFFLDFIIEDKVVLEIKRTTRFSKSDFKQVQGYLKVTGLKLGILASFSSTGVKYKRILNIY